MDGPGTGERSLSVIIPAYNEAGNIEAALENASKACATLGAPYEILVINDCSTDETEWLARKFAKDHPAVRVINNPRNLGFGGAFMAGIREARMRSCIMLCGDNTVDAAQIQAIFAKIGQADLVVPYYSNIHADSFLRKVISWTFVRLVNGIAGRRLRYYNGNNVYPTADLKSLPITPGFAYAAQIVVMLLNRGRTYGEVALLTQFRESGRSKAFRLSNVLSVLRTLASLALRENRFRRRAAPAPAADKPETGKAA